MRKHLGHLWGYELNAGTWRPLVLKLRELLKLKVTLEELSPSSVNKLRGTLSSAFILAADPANCIWPLANPMDFVPGAGKSSFMGTFLQREEVLPFLRAFAPPRFGFPWMWAAALCIYGGLRPGEAFGLDKADIDLKGLLMVVRRSWNRPWPKDKDPRIVPIVQELLPYLRHAMACSPNGIVLPQEDGSHFPGTARWDFEEHVKRAVKNAGLVVGYIHVCRICKGRRNAAIRAGTAATGLEPVEWRHQDGAPRRCPRCGMKLWAVPLPKEFRPYDLRHTFATLSRQSGVDLRAVQHALGHSEIQTTESAYVHVDLLSYRGQFNQALTLLPPWESPPVPAEYAANADGLAGSLLSAEVGEKKEAPAAPGFPKNGRGF